MIGRFLTVAFCLFALGTAAQMEIGGPRNSKAFNDTVWTISGRTPLGPGNRKLKLDFALDARQTLIGTKPTRLGGLRIGIEYRRVHRFGLGFYGLGKGVVLDELPDVDTTITRAKLTLAYQSLYYERVLHFSRKWEWVATCHFGKGVVTGEIERGNSDSQELPKTRLTVLEFSTTGFYNWNYWLSTGAGFGYRSMYGLTDDIEDVYESPVVLLRVRIKLGKLVRSIWDKDTQNLY